MNKKTNMGGGGYMSIKKTGYSSGGMAEKQVARAKDDKGSSKGPKKANEKPVEAAKGGMAKKAKKASFKPCSGCPSPSKCKAAGKCMAKGK